MNSETNADEVSRASDSSSGIPNHVLDTEHDGESIVEMTIRLVNILLEEENCGIQIKPNHLCGRKNEHGRTTVSLFSVRCESVQPV